MLLDVDLHIIMEPTVQIRNLTKVYHTSSPWKIWSQNDSITAVDSVSLSVGKGELFGLLGPNGAGKTTLVKMLCTLILPSSGTATVAGLNLEEEQAIRAVTGLVVSDERSFFWRLSIKRNLDFFAAMQGLYGSRSDRRVQAVLQDVDLLDRADQIFSSLSSGMRQRLAIARALLHQPEILFLDEPTRSLDPIATQRMHALIERLLQDKEMTVFLITHDLSEAEKLCGRVALMHKAQIRQIGRPQDLRLHLNPVRNYTIVCERLPSTKIALLKQQFPSAGIEEIIMTNDTIKLHFQTNEDDGRLDKILDFLRRQGIQIKSIQGSPPSLEEVFTHFTINTDDQ